jgi:hypothetical protein
MARHLDTEVYLYLYKTKKMSTEEIYQYLSNNTEYNFDITAVTTDLLTELILVILILKP